MNISTPSTVWALAASMLGIASWAIGATVTVDTTSDLSDGNVSSITALINSPGGDGRISLREAIEAANNTGNVSQVPDEIHFAIPPDDARHFYYENDGVPGKITLANVRTTTAASDALIGDIDPDFPKSWYRIDMVTMLPMIEEGVVIDGKTQTGYTDSPIVQLNGSALTQLWDDGLLVNFSAANTSILGLVVSNFTGDGLDIRGDESTIQGNYVGTDVSGTIQQRTVRGVIVASAWEIQIGGTGIGQGNLISGNTAGGVVIAGSDAYGVIVEGNLIGTDVTGMQPLGNSGAGVYFWNGANNNTVGGSSPEARNIISANTQYGVLIEDAGSSNNVIIGNYIGTDVNGTADLGNAAAGVRLQDGAANNIIGGTGSGDGNVISGNGDGVYLEDVGTTGNVIQGNYIGTDATGTADLGNSDRGVQIESGANDNTVGGADLGAGNVISGNDNDGVIIADGSSPGTGTTGNVVAGNFIGTDYTGAVVIGNTHHGVHLTTVDNNTIGGTAPGAGNIIAGSTWSGVLVQNADATGNAILSNDIYSSGGLAIDLEGDGVTDNDTNDGDGGANNRQNYPLLTRAITSGQASVWIDGSLNSRGPSRVYRIEFFANAGNDREGERYLGYTTVTTPASTPYTVTFLATISDSVAVGEYISATATDLATDDTSEFSALRQATKALVVTNTNDNINGTVTSVDALISNPGPDGISLREAITAANNSSGLDPILFDISGTGPHTIQPGSGLPPIDGPVIIDGTSEPDFTGMPIVEIDGSFAGSDVPGLHLTPGGSTVRGLVINRFTASGIRITGSGGNTIEGNYIGTDTSGMLDRGNGTHGIHVDSDTGGNTIGGATSSARNLISGNGENGIYLQSTSSNVVHGNFIGTDRSGAPTLGNRGHGILIHQGSGHQIGGTLPNHTNLISGNQGSGVAITG